jgi:putative ABC transport system permease protein
LPFWQTYASIFGKYKGLALQTEISLALRATGDNELMIRSQGVNTDMMKILGLALSNGLVAFAGSYVAQNQQFADVSMGITGDQE